MEPEKAHKFTLDLLGFALAIPGSKSIFKSLYSHESESLEREVFGLKFKNPVGLAAGFDKDGKYMHKMKHLGFGFLELGTVTPKPQIGNPQPRLFRLPKDEALINRMGFNNEGVDALVKNLKNFDKGDLILGGNIGKNKTTPNENAVDDYVVCFEKLHDFVDYFVVNVSSPNTPGLRELQEKDALLHILQTLNELNQKKSNPKPILLKIAPDLNNDQLDDIVDNVLTSGISGIIATNTTIERNLPNTKNEQIEKIGNGGLSGKPVAHRSTEVIKYLVDKTKSKVVIIGVGGIDSPKAAKEKLEAGATLVQIYSGLVYQGPGLVKRINKEL